MVDWWNHPTLKINMKGHANLPPDADGCCVGRSLLVVELAQVVAHARPVPAGGRACARSSTCVWRSWLADGVAGRRRRGSNRFRGGANGKRLEVADEKR